MALTDEDKKRLSKQDQERITAATAKWEAANAAGDEAGKKAAADEAKRIREQAGYYTDSYGRYQGNFNQSSKNEQIVVTSEQAAMDKAFNEGFWGTDVNGFTPISLISPARPTIKNNQQNTAYQGKSSNEDLYGAKTTVKNTTAAPNNAEQHPWQTDDEHYAFMEGLMGEDYVKAYKANTKNTAQNKQENPINAANNKNNSASSTSNAETATKKTVRSEGLHYLPNGGTDSKGNSLPAGSYIRVQNGTEYVVLPNDPRIKERIAAEYAAQEAAKQDKPPISPEQKEIPEVLQIGAEKTAAEPNAEDDEDWENAFSGSDSEDEEIDLPPRLMDDIASDIFVSDFLWENGLKPVYKVGENDKKIIEIKLKNGETIILKEDEDFCYGYDGTPYFTKDFVEKNGHLALIGNNSQSDTKEGTIVNEAGNIYGINYDIAENGYGMIIDVAEEDISKWQDPSWMTSEKQYDSLDEKYGEIYSQWKVTQGFNDTMTNKKGHLGIDMVPQDPNDTGIYPIFPGEIVFIQAENLSANGVCIVIKHSINGIIFYSAYGHMANSSVPLSGEGAIKVGSIVDINTRIGTMGGTGGLDKNDNQIFIDEHLHLSVFTAPEAYANRGFYGYYVKGRNKSFAPEAYFTNTNQDANRTYYDPLKVMQSNGQIICYNDSTNDKNLKTQKI